MRRRKPLIVFMMPKHKRRRIAEDFKRGVSFRGLAIKYRSTTGTMQEVVRWWMREEEVHES